MVKNNKKISNFISDAIHTFVIMYTIPGPVSHPPFWNLQGESQIYPAAKSNHIDVCHLFRISKVCD